MSDTTTKNTTNANANTNTNTSKGSKSAAKVVKGEMPAGMKTFHLKQKEVAKKWLLFDAENQVLGRFASRIASHLRGKTKPQYSPHLDCGDNVIVINADKIVFKGNKKDKRYYRHSGYPGGIKSLSLEEMMLKKPEQVVYNAIRGMLNNTPLGRKQLGNLKIYAGSEHPHQAQLPEKVEL